MYRFASTFALPPSIDAQTIGGTFTYVGDTGEVLATVTAGYQRDGGAGGVGSLTHFKADFPDGWSGKVSLTVGGDYLATIPIDPPAVKAGDPMTLTPGERDAIADATLDRVNGIEPGLTFRQAMRIIAAVVAGRVTINGNTVTIRSVGDAKARVVATTTPDGERSSVTIDPD